MKTQYSKMVWTIGLMGLSAAALADAPPTKPPPQEPAGFITGAVIGGFAAGPIGAVVGAGLGTWLGNRVHRAGEARKAEAQVALLKGDKLQLQTIKSFGPCEIQGFLFGRPMSASKVAGFLANWSR